MTSVIYVLLCVQQKNFFSVCSEICCFGAVFMLKKRKKKQFRKFCTLTCYQHLATMRAKIYQKNYFWGVKKKKFHLKRSELGESNSSNKNKTKVFFCKNRNIQLYVKYSPFKYSSPFLSTVFSWLPPFALLEVTSLFFLSSRM